MSNKNKKHWKIRLHEIIYEADTKEGKLFDVVLLFVIVASIIIVMLESINSFNAKYNNILNIFEWVITILFTIEYLLRVFTVKNPIKYIFSFYGIIDLLSTIPKYLSFFLTGSTSLVALRALRLMRVFRILKLTRYLGEYNNFVRSLKRSKAKISVFLSFVLIMCIILGTIMYLIESDQDSGFTSIPRSVYWAIVTLTTVGYGDIAPATALGQLIASLIMVLGYGIIAIPTGIVGVEMTKKDRDKIPTNTQTCSNCMETYHLDGAKYCHNCGTSLH